MKPYRIATRRQDWGSAISDIREKGMPLKVLIGRIRSTQPTLTRIARGSAEPRHWQGVLILSIRNSLVRGWPLHRAGAVPIDWPKLVAGLIAAGFSKDAVAAQCGVGVTTIKQLLDGASLPYYDCGQRLLAMRNAIRRGQLKHEDFKK